MRTPKQDLLELINNTGWVYDLDDLNTVMKQVDLDVMELVIVKFRDTHTYGYTIENKQKGKILVMSVNVDKKNLFNEIVHSFEAIGIPMDTY